MSHVNREYKERLFRFIFGNPSHKQWTLDLYNAINGTDYKDPDEIQITTLENVVYMSMKNDISFLFADTMNFYESQSTYNPNMPMRYLIYAGLVYNTYAENTKNNINLYSSTLQKFPAPRFICFYDGLLSAPEKTVLSLEDAFSEGSHSDISIRVTMYNINYGKNKQLMDDCSPLKEYSMFVKEVRNGLAEGLTIEDAISRAIDKLPDDGSIKSFLVNHKNEVTSMCLTEYDEQKNLNAFKEEGILIGMAKGIEQGMAKGIEQGMAKGIEQGKKEGEIKLGQLIEKMITMGRIDDATRAARDESYRELLYKEFGITD